MYNTIVFDTVEVVKWPLAINNEQLAMNNLTVYPNPAKDLVTVSHAIGDYVYLYNEVCELASKQNVFCNKAELQVGRLPKGVYVVKALGQVTKVVIR
jgi:exosome complex RNA-binding protein Rrp4